MAANYLAIPLERTVQVISQTQIADVQRLGVTTKPTGIYVETQVPWAAWEAEGAAPWAGPLATAIESLVSGGLATYATFAQDVDQSGLIADFLDFLVTYSPPGGSPIPLTTTVRIPVPSLTIDTGFGGALNTYFAGASGVLDPAQALRDAYDALVKTVNE